MVPSTPTTSTRLRLAAKAERTELARHRDLLVAARASLREELDRIEVSLGEVDERDTLLSRLAPGLPGAGPVDNTGPAAPTASITPSGGDRLLRGPAIRHAAVRVLLDHSDRPEALHYRRWYEVLTAAGYSVAGKDPLAVFLTQLNRSPVVSRGTQTGVYAVDLHAPRRLRDRLDHLHAAQRALASTPASTADLAAIRARRAETVAETARVERALEEAEVLLAPTRNRRQPAG